MSYLGNEPQFTQYPSKFFNGDGSAMTVTLDYAPPNAAALLVFIDGVRQDTSAYTLAGTSMTFTGTVASGTNNVQVVHMGLTVDVGVPGDNSVTLAKMEHGTQGDILYYASTGTPSRLGSGTSGYFLKTLGASTNPAWAEVPAGAPTGASGEAVFFNNETQVDYSYSIPASTNSLSAGPITVASGVTVTVPSGSVWVIV